MKDTYYNIVKLINKFELNKIGCIVLGKREKMDMENITYSDIREVNDWLNLEGVENIPSIEFGAKSYIGINFEYSNKDSELRLLTIEESQKEHEKLA